MFFKKQNTGGVYDLLLVGLGNPGVQYRNTRHNAGFDVIDAFCEKHSLTLNKNRYKAVFGECTVHGKRVLVAKPQTFMNLSGEAVKAISGFYKIPAENILVVSDDISLAPGKIRIRTKGSAGGQKGLESIIEHLSTDEFARIKMGVGDRPDRDSDLAAWVLGRMNGEEKELFDKAKENAVNAIETIIRDGVDSAMNRYNR